MSRSTFLTTTSSLDASETPNHTTTSNANPDRTTTLRFHHRLMPTISSTSRSNETLPVVVVQSSSTTTTTTDTTTTTTNTTQHKSVVRLNPKLKRNIRGKRRSTGIRPDEVSMATAMSEANVNDEDEEEDKSSTCNQYITITSNEPSESFDPSRTSPPKPVFKVSRLQPTFDENSRHAFEKLSITRTDPFIIASSSAITNSYPTQSTITSPYPTQTTKIFRPEEFILRRQASEDDAGSVKRRQLEERICKLESLIYDKDSIIHELQRQLEKMTRDLKDAEQQIYILQRDKLALMKTVAALQDAKGSSGGDISTSPKRTGFMTRN